MEEIALAPMDFRVLCLLSAQLDLDVISYKSLPKTIIIVLGCYKGLTPP